MKLPNRRVVRGAGGGAQQPATPINENNTLRSRSYARVIDMLGWGEWEGLVDGAKSIYVDDTPLISVVDGQDQSNFDGLTWTFLSGTQTQGYIPGFDSVENPIDVAVKVRTTAPVIRTISNHEADKVIVTVNIPRLYEQKSNGDVVRKQLSIRVSIALNGGAYSEVLVWSWYDKCMSDYFESREFALPKSVNPETDTWQIKLERLTPDHDGSSTVFDDIFWGTYSEVVTQKLSYPNLALCGIELDSASFSKIPVRSFDVKMRRVQVPQNYDPVTRVYATTGLGTTAGGWDGTFKTAWTDSPAWVFYDLISNKLFGLGKYINVAYLDKWTLYEISQYCDALVPDGKGGLEPRMTCNVYIQAQEDALKVLSDFASVFRGMLYYFNGRVVPVQDRPKSSFVVFSKANVKNGIFSYASTGRRARHTVVTVRFADKDDFYRPTWQQVEDLDGIVRFGYQELEAMAFGCTSRGQAHRYGKYLLETEKREYEGISFRTGQEALMLRIGDIIEVQDADRAQAQFGGRLPSGSTTTSITLDRTVLIESGKTYQLTLVLPKAVTDVQDVTNSTQTAGMRNTQIETKTATAGLGNQLTLTTSAFSVAPPAGTVWILTSSTLATQKFRVLAIKETDKAEWEVSANAYVVAKFDNTEVDPNFTTPPVIRFPVDSRVEPVGNVNAIVRNVNRPDGIYQYLDVSWENLDPYANLYHISYSHDGGAVVGLPDTSVPFISFLAPVPGNYAVSIWAVRSMTGTVSAPTVYQVNVGAANPLYKLKVTGLELKDLGNITTFDGKDAVLIWRVNSLANEVEMGAEDNGALADKVDPLFSHYIIKIRANGAIVHSDICYDATYTFTFEKNKLSGGPFRQFTVYVTPVDLYNNQGFMAELTVRNPAPAVPDVVISQLFSAANFNFSFPNDTDFRGYLIWASTSSGFTPGPSNLVYDGPDSQPTLPAIPDTNYYAKYAAYDAFDKTSLNVSAEVPFSSSTTTPPGVPAGLALTTTYDQNPDGSSRCRMKATWTANGEADMEGYYLVYTPSAFAPVGETLMGAATTQFEWDAKDGLSYSVVISAFNKSGNQSAFSSAQVLSAAVDTTAPAVPTWISAAIAYRVGTLRWNSVADKDVHHYELWENTTNNSGTATKIRDVLLTTAQTSYPLTGLITTTTYYYWLKAVDNSGNASAFSSVQSLVIPALVAPTSSALTTGVEVDADGTQRVWIQANWTDSSTVEVVSYLVEVYTDAGLTTFYDSALVFTTKAKFYVAGNVAYWIRVRGNDGSAGFSPWATTQTATSSKDSTAPAAPTGVSAVAAFKTVYLAWTNPTDKDYLRTNVYRATTNSFPGGTPYARVSGNAFGDANITLGQIYYYFLKSEDTSNNETASPTASVNATPGTINTADITNFAVDLTKQYSATVALASGAAFTNNSPGAGRVAWNAHTLYYQGASYSISSGSTPGTEGYIYWDSASPTTYQVSATNPSLTNSQFMIATNVGGVHDLAWQAIANAMIGSAYIQDLAVTNAKILSLVVDKLTSGSIAAQVISLTAGGTRAVIKSSNWNGTVDGSNVVLTNGTAGFFLNSDGKLIANDGVFRGSLVAGTISIGTNAFQVDSSGNLWMGAATFGSAPFSVSAAGALVASSATISGVVDIGTGINRTLINSATLARGVQGQNRSEMYANGSNYTAFRCYNWDGASTSYEVLRLGTEATYGYGILRLCTNVGVEKLQLDGSTGRVVVYESFKGPYGNASGPTFTFHDSAYPAVARQDGMFSLAAGIIGFGVSGVEALSVGLGVIEIAKGRSAAGDCFIDFHSETQAGTYPDYNFRIMRISGANGTAQISHQGTGSLDIECLTAGSQMRFLFNGTALAALNAGGVIWNNDIRVYRVASASTGVVYFGSSGSNYVYFDATHFQLSTGATGGQLYVNGDVVVNVWNSHRSRWNTYGMLQATAGQLGWKNYGNGHTIIDASAATAPDGTAISNTNAANGWTATYPMLVGWNGTATHGVRVDSARIADLASSVTWANVSGKQSMATRELTISTSAPSGGSDGDVWFQYV